MKKRHWWILLPSGALFALVLTGILGFTHRTLLLRQQISQSMAEQNLRHQTAAVGLYIEERRCDIEMLAASPIVASYFKNRALGMSLRYGLGASLVHCVTLFEDELQGPNRSRFDRLVFFEPDGTILAESDDRGSNYTYDPLDKRRIRFKHRAGVFAFSLPDEARPRIVVACPVTYKGDTAGYLAGLLDISDQGDSLVLPDAPDIARALILDGLVVSYSGPLTLLKTAETRMPTSTVGVETTTAFHFRGEEPQEGLFVCLAARVAGTRFRLINVMTSDRYGGGFEPTRVTALSAALIALFGLLLFISIRSGWRNSVLVGQLQSEQKAMSCISEKNTILEDEIGRRRRIETELRAAKREAEVASQTKSQFLANMSHELRTPLTAILGYAQMLEDSLEDTSLRDASRRVSINGGHLLNLINDILDLSKIEAGKMPVFETVCAPRALVEEVVEMVRPTIESKEVALEVAFDPELPETLRTDPVRLRQILINLLGNAAKFTHRGKVEVNVAITEDRKRLTIAVADTGIGMNDQQLARLFQPFSQADDSSTRSYGGTGLGLYVSSRLAGLLGGTLAVESRPNVGSTFTLHVAVKSCGAMEHDGRKNTKSKSPGAGRTPLGECASVPFEASLEGRRILLAEDGPDNRRIIEHYLEKSGAEVVIAENGEEAVRLVQEMQESQRPFDLVLMDIQMPVLDGFGAAQRLRDLGFERPIIALTAIAMKGDDSRCLDAGCSAYLTKPIDWPSLFETLRRSLDSIEMPAGGR